MAYIDTNELFKCETCRRYKGDKCLAWCENGACYSPNMKKIPTADVVPKSEVFLASSDAMKMLMECHGYALTHDADVKKEVALEIFEEIEQWFDERIDFYKKMKFKASLGYDETQYKYAETFITNLQIYREEIAELKKKYTEKKKDEN